MLNILIYQFVLEVQIAKMWDKKISKQIYFLNSNDCEINANSVQCLPKTNF